MKKYDGTITWYETLYFYRLDEDDIEWRKECDESGQDMKPGDTEFYVPSPPFGEHDKNAAYLYDIFMSGFEDKNWFINDTEEFNWIKLHRI